MVAVREFLFIDCGLPNDLRNASPHLNTPGFVDTRQPHHYPELALNIGYINVCSCPVTHSVICILSAVPHVAMLK